MKTTSSPPTLRRLSKAIALFLSLCLVVSLPTFTAQAQESGTGTIRGTVTNASTGNALYNAEVRIEGTNRVTYTDEYGTYRFYNVPAGPVTIVTNYTGLRQRRTEFTVEASQTTYGNVLMISDRSTVADEDIVVLDEYTVNSSITDSDAIALNQQRTSTNLRTVMHSGALGEITEGNIGEYLKNLSGVSINYVAADVRSIKLRGVSSQFTNVTVDGAQMASAGSGNKIRSFELEQVSLANVEMLEVLKLPRPQDPANAMGGQVNLVTKNAFQRDGAEFKWKVYANFNSKYTSISPTPGWPGDAKKAKVWPGLEVSYANSFMDNRLGLQLGYSNSNNFNIQQRFRWREWDFSPEGGSGGPEEVYFLRQQIQDGPKFTNRQAAYATLDFKFTDDTIFSLKTQYNKYKSEFRNRNVDWRIRNVDEDTADNTFSRGDERSTSVGGSWRDKFGDTWHVDASMKHYMGDWTLDYGAWYSVATNHYDDVNHRTLETITTNVNGIDEISFSQESGVAPFTDIVAYDSAGNEIPNRGIVLSNTVWERAHTRLKNSEDELLGAWVDLSKDFNFGEWQAQVKGGLRISDNNRFAYENRFRWATNQEIRNALSLEDFRDNTYADISPGFGYEGWFWPSNERMRNYFVDNPSQFDFDETDSFNRLIASKFDMSETISSAYIQGDAKFMDGRFNILGGVRFEDTSISGTIPSLEGGDYSVSEDGTLVVDYANPSSSYNTWHPSIHARYEALDGLIFRLSYAETIGRQNLQDLWGVTTVNDPDENDPDDNDGSVQVSNPALLPRESNNIDFTVEYYYNPQGFVSASYFHNDISNFVSSVQRDVTQADVDTYDLPPRVLGGNGVPPYQITVPEILGDGTVDGFELSWNQGMAFDWIPESFRGSTVYANGTFLDTKGDFGGSSPFTDDFPDFVKETVNGGFALDYKNRVNLMFRWNYIGDGVFASSTSGLATVRSYELNDVSGSAALYVRARTTVDMNLEIGVTDKITFFINGRNITNAPQVQAYLLPTLSGGEHAILDNYQNFGSQWTTGFKGVF